MFGHPPVCLDAPICVALLATLFTPICLDGPCMFECPNMLEHPLYVCMPHVWTPPICLDAPICLDVLLYVWMSPCMFGCPHMCSTAGNTFQPAAMFGCPLYFLMHPYVWTPPICLDAPFMFGHPLYVWMSPYVWIHPLYVWMPTYAWMAPCMFECPHMFGHLPVCLDAPICVATILNFCQLEFLPFCFSLILNILSTFQNIPLSFDSKYLSFALCVLWET